MNEITIVKRRSRLLPVLLTLLIVAILILAGLWMLGMLPGVAPASFDFARDLRFDVHHIGELASGVFDCAPGGAVA